MFFFYHFMNERIPAEIAGPAIGIKLAAVAPMFNNGLVIGRKKLPTLENPFFTRYQNDSFYFGYTTV